MDTNEMDTGDGSDPEPTRDRKKPWLATGALAAGLAIGAAGVAGAATGSGSSANSDSSGAGGSSAPAASGYGQAPTGQPPTGQAPAGQGPSGQAPSGAQDPSAMPNGPGETLLTGDTAEKVKAAALEAVPGATVIRVETDSGDAEYEAHLKTSDGSFVTVLLDADFEVTGTEDGFGPGPQGQAGQPPQGAPRGGSQAYGGSATSN